MTQFLRDDLTENEREFIQRLGWGWDLIGVGLPAIIDTIPDGELRNRPPLSTVWRLEVGLATRCLAAIRTLDMPQTSEGALVLLRNVIEAFAHIAFIKGLPGAKGNTTCRALRYEIGATTEARNTALKIGPDAGDVEAEYQRRLTGLRGIETECACGTHPPLTDGHVATTVKALAEKDSALKALSLIYSDASRATHMFSGADHIVGLNDQGEPTTWVPLYKRAAWFVWTLIVFGHASFDAEIIIDCPTGSGLVASGAAEGLQKLINDPILEKMGKPSDSSRRLVGPPR